jgi:hypothetical protein
VLCRAVLCRQALGKYAGFQLGQRKQLQEVFDELGKPAEKRSAGVFVCVIVCCGRENKQP